MKKAIQLMAIISIVASVPIPILAQDDVLEKNPPTQSRDRDERESTSPKGNENVKDESQAAVSQTVDLQQLKAELEALRAETKAKDAELERINKEHAERLDEIDNALMSVSGEDPFSIYGFFDLAFHKDFPEKDSIVHGLAPEKTSFILSNVNLYFRSQLAETLSTLVELHFTFLPLGYETSLELEGASEYERTDTTVTAPYSYKSYRLGGVGIERAQLTWQPWDYFGILAGYYLTPYGIWNIDHGSPTLIPVREPYMQFSEVVPLHQLGLQAFGRIWTSTGTYLDYAVTLSNGRGPMDSVQDLDENKGVGFRLRAVAEAEDFNLGFGGYGYYGDYTDIKKVITSVAPRFSVEQEVTQSYSELIGALDFLFEMHGVRFQAEYVRRLNQYTKRPLRSLTSGAGGYQPDYINQSVYGILAWTLPLHEWLQQMTLTPYFEADYSIADDTIDDTEAIILLGGINFKPFPRVVLKAEGGLVNSINSSWLDSTFVSGQMAVSF